MRYLFEKNNSWFCNSTLLTQQTIRREGSLWKPLGQNLHNEWHLKRVRNAEQKNLPKIANSAQGISAPHAKM